MLSSGLFVFCNNLSAWQFKLFASIEYMNTSILSAGSLAVDLYFVPFHTSSGLENLSLVRMGISGTKGKL